MKKYQLKGGFPRNLILKASRGEIGPLGVILWLFSRLVRPLEVM
jgi:hypothetical protein